MFKMLPKLLWAVSVSEPRHLLDTTTTIMTASDLGVSLVTILTSDSSLRLLAVTVIGLLLSQSSTRWTSIAGRS